MNSGYLYCFSNQSMPGVKWTVDGYQLLIFNQKIRIYLI